MNDDTICSGVLMAVIALGLNGCEGSPAQEIEVKVDSFAQIIEKNSCLACHLPGNQMNLPIWQDVAKKYRNIESAELYLINKIRKGGSGAWGKMDMPPYQELDDPTLKVIAQGILATEYHQPIAKLGH